ncbi:hypothetical protein Hypma_009901 [Hypsizygus marmoreus]|uniref:Uncharacterized protein n=1 Tax=Hypsizygus marmoreus TaxID=39966 RepID=A0A369JNM5_HYPMA|nr:hypothetical protein Hypma_009901 [Hypsizygus marmoreus]
MRRISCEHWAVVHTASSDLEPWLGADSGMNPLRRMNTHIGIKRVLPEITKETRTRRRMYFSILIFGISVRLAWYGELAAGAGGVNSALVHFSYFHCHQSHHPQTAPHSLKTLPSESSMKVTTPQCIGLYAAHDPPRRGPPFPCPPQADIQPQLRIRLLLGVATRRRCTLHVNTALSWEKSGKPGDRRNGDDVSNGVMLTSLKMYRDHVAPPPPGYSRVSKGCLRCIVYVGQSGNFPVRLLVKPQDAGTEAFMLSIFFEAFVHRDHAFRLHHLLSMSSNATRASLAINVCLITTDAGQSIVSGSEGLKVNNEDWMRTPKLREVNTDDDEWNALTLTVRVVITQSSELLSH